MKDTRKMFDACDFSDHEPGSQSCQLCAQGYPQPCRCGGLLHAEVVKVEGDGYLQLTHCDRCGWTH